MEDESNNPKSKVPSFSIDGYDSLLIPIRGSDESVEVKLDELPEDPSDILDILKAEVAPLELWLKFAVAYFKQGRVEAFKQILLEGADPGIEEFYGEFKKERIAILNTLAAYYTNLASKQKEKNKREELLTLATQNYNRADKIEILEEMTWVGKGVLLLTRGDVARANEFFDTVLRKNNKNIPALLGKAGILYNKGSYEEALKCYKMVLKTNPQCPATVRLGIGLCYNKLDKHEEAKMSFERVIQLDPKNVEALVALAIIEMNSEGTKAIPKAMGFIKRAYEVNSNNSMVLNYLSEHYFYRGDYEKAQNLALQAYHSTDVDKIKAEACFNIARAYHARSEYDYASQYYFQATQHWSDYPLAQFRLGQMYIHKNEVEKAIRCFEGVLASYPDNYESLKILGSLYSQTNKEKAYANLKRACELNGDDLEAWIELAQLSEANPQEALNAYLKAKKIMEKKNDKIPSELWNNVGVLQHVLGQLKEAEESYTRAIASSGHELKEYEKGNITTTYNLARLKEDTHYDHEAEELYKGILQEHPNYIDCYLRLGLMAQSRGQIYEASVWFKDAFTSNSKLPEAMALLGNLHLQKGKLADAQKRFEKILETDRHDLYALLSLGNIYYLAKFEKKDKEERYLKFSFDFYWKVLQMDPSNIYAANGIGTVFAERGKLNEAKDFFIQVREATAETPDVWINLAHVYLAQGQHVNAIKMYQTCLKKFYHNKDITVLTYLAKAYFEAGKMEDSKQTLQRALHIDPHRKDIWLDLALSQEQLATDILRKEKRTLPEIKKAIQELTQATVIFKNLITSEAKNVIGSRAEKHSKYCDSTIVLAKKQKTRAEEQERLLAERRERMRQEAEAALLEKAMEEEQRQRIERELRQKEDTEARLWEEKGEQLAQSLKPSKSKNSDSEPEPEGGKKRKKKKKDKFIDDSENPDVVASEGEPEAQPIEGEEEGDEEFKDFKERSDQGKALSELAARRRAEKGEKEKKKRKKKERAEGEGEEEEGKKKKKKKKKKRKISDFVVDSDEEAKKKETEEGNEENKEEEAEGEKDEVEPTEQEKAAEEEAIKKDIEEMNELDKELLDLV